MSSPQDTRGGQDATSPSTTCQQTPSQHTRLRQTKLSFSVSLDRPKSTPNPYAAQQHPPNPASYVQHTLPDNALSHIENVDYGDTVHAKQPGHYRQYGGNINGMSPADQFSSVSDLGLQASQHQADGVSYIECNVDFQFRAAHHRIRHRLAPAWDRKINFISSNSDRNFGSFYQPGGVCQLMGNGWINRIITASSDDSGLGQWTYHTLQGSADRKITIITAYQVCDTRHTLGEKTAWKQRQSIITSLSPHDENPDPRQYFRTSITRFINQLTTKGHGILLFIDANSDISANNSWLHRFLHDTTLSDVFAYRHGYHDQFPTYKRGSARIDFMLASTDLLPYISACGYLSFDSGSDHRSMFTDVNMSGYLRDEAPPDNNTAGHRTILSRHKKLSREYKAAVLQELNDGHLAARVSALAFNTIDSDTLTPGDIHEIEAIDALITRSMVNNEQKFSRTHDSPWSPTLLQFLHHFEYWNAWLSEIRTGIDLSARRSYRVQAANKAGGPITQASIIRPSVEHARKQQRISRNQLKAAQKQAKKLREEWLLEQEDMAADTNQYTTAKILRAIRKSEATRRTHQVVRQALSGHRSSGLTSLIVPDPHTQLPTTIFDPTDITERLIARNLHHFHQADGTQFTNPTIQATCKAPFVDALLALQQHTGQGDDAFDAVISELSDSTTDPDLSMGLINGQDLAGKFRKWKEATSTSPSRRHLGLYRAILKAPNPVLTSNSSDSLTVDSDYSQSTQPDHGAGFFHSLAQIINICVSTGYVLQRWRKIVSVMLEKIPNRPLIDKLRVIHLFEADFNAWAGIVFGRRMMQRAENARLLGEEQGGSRKGRTATDVYAMKFLSFQMAEITRTHLAVMDNDAKACYDRIVLALASQRCEHLGVPHNACRLLENFLDSANYHISTTLGVSNSSYSSSEAWKLHGPGQGSQCSPAIWAVVSTLLFKTMKTKFPGTSYFDPSRHLEINHHMQAFVDDSSIWVNNFTASLLESTNDNNILNQLQTATQWWEKLLTVSGGKLELSKCFYYFIKWRFNKNGEPTLDTTELHSTILINQSEGNQSETIPRKNSTVSHRTLGFQASPVNTFKDQGTILMTKSQQITKALYASRLDPAATIAAYRTVFLPRITYAFPMCGLSRAYLNSVQSGPLGYTLQSLGYPKTFPRSMVFLSQNEGGLGYSTLFTDQGVANILFIIRHLRQKSTLGKFLSITFRWFQHFAGTGFCLLRCPHIAVPYLPSQWFKTLREFLSTISGAIYQCDEPVLQPRRQNDRFLMDIAILHFPKQKALQHINAIRLFLQVTMLSDICTIEGKQLVFPARFQPTRHDFPSKSTEEWPVQPKPGNRCWTTWIQLLRIITADGQRLREPLGPWFPLTNDRTWPVCYDPEESHVYVATGGKWALHPFATHDTRGTRLNCAHPNLFDDLATVVIPLGPPTRQTYDQGAPVFVPVQSPPLPVLLWHHYITTLPSWEYDLLRHTQDSIQSEGLSQFLQATNRHMHIVSDGGHITNRGSFGWVIASESQVLWSGWGIARGTPMSSYRAEAYGRLAAIQFLLRFREYLHICISDDLHIETACDNDSLLKNERYCRNATIPNPYLHQNADADVIAIINESYQQIHQTVTHNHVYGHQDDHDRVDELPWVAQLNIEADRLATHALRQQAEPAKFLPLPCSAYLLLDGKMITSKYTTMVQAAAGTKEGRNYLERKLGLSSAEYCEIAWDGFHRARRALTVRQQAFASKRLCGWLSTHAKQHHENPTISPACRHCAATSETADHVFQCPALTAWRSDFLYNFHATLLELHTPTSLRNTIHNDVSAWLHSQLGYAHVSLWMRGCLPSQWSTTIDNHLKSQGQLTHTCNGILWTKKICTFIFTGTHKAWCIRSSMIDEASQTQHDFQHRQAMSAAITELYLLKHQCTLKYPFSMTLERRLLFNNDHLSAWLANHKANILRGHTKWKTQQKQSPQRDIRHFFPVIRRTH